MTILANIEQEPAVAERRGSRRRRLRLETAGSTTTAPDARVVIHDLSLTGFLMETQAKLSTGERLEVDLPEWGAAEAEIVWHSGAFFGCKFNQPISSAAISAALLRSAPRPAERTASELVSIALREVQELSARVREVADRLESTIDELSIRGR